MRSESLFFSGLSADDIFGSSENLNQLVPTFEDVKINYVPMSVAQISESADSDCVTYAKLPSTGATLATNGSAGDHDSAADSIKSNLFARPTVSVSLLNKDPFSNYGKISVVIDRQTGAVVYKKIWNRDGTDKGTVINGLYQSTNPKAVVPAWTYRENKSGSVSTVYYHRIEVCNKASKNNWDLTEFDPGKLGKIKSQ